MNKRDERKRDNMIIRSEYREKGILSHSKLGPDSIDKHIDHRELIKTLIRVLGIDEAYTMVPFPNQVDAAIKLFDKLIKEGFNHTLFWGLLQSGKTQTAFAVCELMERYWKKEKINGKILYLTMVGRVDIEKQTSLRKEGFKLIGFGEEFDVHCFRPNESEILFENRLTKLIETNSKNQKLFIVNDEIVGTKIDSNIDKRLFQVIANMNLDIKTLTVTATPAEFIGSKLYKKGCVVTSTISNGWAGCATPFGSTRFKKEKGAKTYPIEVIGSVSKDLQIKMGREEVLTTKKLKEIYNYIISCKEKTGRELWEMIFRVPEIKHADTLRKYLFDRGIRVIPYYGDFLKSGDENLEKELPILVVNAANMAKTLPKRTTVGIDFCPYTNTNIASMLQGVYGRLHGYKFKKLYYFTSKEAADYLNIHSICNEIPTNRKLASRVDIVSQPITDLNYISSLKNAQKTIEKIDKLVKGIHSRSGLSKQSMKLCSDLIDDCFGEKGHEIKFRFQDFIEDNGKYSQDNECIARARAYPENQKVAYIWRVSADNPVYEITTSSYNNDRKNEVKTNTSLYNTIGKKEKK